MRTLKIAVVLLCLLSAIPVSAQVLYGSLTGNVADATGAALPNARIEARNSNTGITRQTTSDERGLYLFNDLQPGSYDISIGATSFSSVVEKAVSINANTVRRLDVSMQLATVAESVIVTGSAATLQTDRADINTQLQTSQVTNLPVAAGRNFQQLYKIVPGFSTPADAHSDAGNPQRALVSNVNGMSYSNNIRVSTELP
ncbi:MAG: carboxypeptidase regulatory-like domain-containing protein [Bryobacteraceae bacterium]|nr:carboxypeptidase regulatory-like domain-containing protein [Bryobacteraceae bacterium]